VYNQRATLKLDPESARLVEVTYKDFVHAGAKLSEADKTKLKALNGEESTLSTQFTNKLLAATKDGALVVDDKAKLWTVCPMPRSMPLRRQRIASSTANGCCRCRTPRSSRSCRN
jgi:Zn-dependent oligopeptidase